MMRFVVNSSGDSQKHQLGSSDVCHWLVVQNQCWVVTNGIQEQAINTVNFSKRFCRWLTFRISVYKFFQLPYLASKQSCKLRLLYGCFPSSKKWNCLRYLVCSSKGNTTPSTKRTQTSILDKEGRLELTMALVCGGYRSFFVVIDQRQWVHRPMMK